MHTERTMVPAVRDALIAACPVVREGVPASDAIAGVVPSFVAFPASTDEASALLRAAAAHQLAVVARGAGTGLGWGAPPASADLVIDLQAMDQVLEHAAGDLVARVQAGVTMGHLASVLASAGQELALDAPRGRTAGGVVATGTAGPRRLRYGAPRDLLIGITVVRADGMVAHSGGKVVKNVAGYDLGKLFCGSAGTLGLITEATFRLHPVPAAVAYLTAEFGPAGATWPVRWPRRRLGRWSRRPCSWTPAAGQPGDAGGGAAGGHPVRGGRAGPADGRLLSAARCPMRRAPAVSIRHAPPGWGRLPPAGTVIGVSFWVAALADVLSALRPPGRRRESGSRSPARPARAWSTPAWIRAGPAADHDAAAARFVTALRERLAPGRAWRAPTGLGPAGR